MGHQCVRMLEVGAQHFHQNTQLLSEVTKWCTLGLLPRISWVGYSNLTTLGVSFRSIWFFPFFLIPPEHASLVNARCYLTPSKVTCVVWHTAQLPLESTILPLDNAWCLSASPEIPRVYITSQVIKRGILNSTQSYNYTLKSWIRWVIICVITRFWWPTN